MKSPISVLKKSVKIEELLGLPPATTASEYYIKSPFRGEKTPSFKINPRLNTWYDFGEGVGGSNIDLVMRLRNCTAGEAIKILRNGNFPIANIGACGYSGAVRKAPQNGVKLHEIKDFGNNKAIADYICGERKIARKAAERWLKEVYYYTGDKHRFGAGFGNDSGGWEIRSKYFKGCVGGKSVTTIRKDNGKVAIFEGFIDFLSALTYYGLAEPNNDVIVLNTLALCEKLDLSNYEEIRLFLDNDEAGRSATKKLVKKYNAKDYSHLYKGYKDFNEMLIVTK